MNQIVRYITILAVLLLAPTVNAHHNWQAIYDIESDIEIEATVDSLHWRNPHVQMTVSGTDQSGATKTWMIDSSSVATITRMGLNKELLSTGTTVKIAGYRSRQSDDAMFLTHLLLPDGREMIFKRGAAPRWTDGAIGNSDRLQGKIVENDVSKRPDSIFSIWTTVWGAKGSHHMMPSGSAAYKLTPMAIKRSTALDLINNHPLNNCAPKGMPSAMTQPYPIELIDNGDTLLIRLEEYDGVRTIHMTNAHDDRAIAPSLFGYSTGRWDGDTLYITTTKMDYDWLALGTTPLPLPQSENMFIGESFTLSVDRNRLNYTMDISDLDMLMEPMSFEKYYQYQPGADLEPYQCD